MSAGLALGRAQPGRWPSLFDADGAREGTLAQHVAATWEALAAAGSASCPVCGGTMAARAGPDRGRAVGHCPQCGSELA